MLRELRQEVLKIIYATVQQTKSGQQANMLTSLSLSHAFSSGVTNAMTSTINQLTSITVTPRVTGKYRIIGMGNIANNSTTQAAVSFQLGTQSTTGGLITVLQTQNIEVPGTSTVGYTTPLMAWGVVTEISSGAALTVGSPINLLVNAGITSGITNTLSVQTGSQLSVQEIL